MKGLKITTVLLLSCVAVAIFNSGCMSAEELRAERISSNQTMFYQLDPAVRDRVSKGQISIGDTTTAVWLALGPASKVSSDTTAAGSIEIWQYYTQVPEDYTVLVVDPPPPHLPPPPPGALLPSHYETRTRYVSAVRLQIQFDNGLVSRIQQF